MAAHQTTEEMMAAIGAMCRPMASIQTTTDMFAAIDSLVMSRAPAVAPISAEQAKATRAALDAKFRAGETVMNRDARGCFTGAVKVASFGGEPVAVEVPAFHMAAE